MEIRKSVTSDLDAIKQLHLDAFSGQAGTSSEESSLVATLAVDLIGASPSVLSLVAVDEEGVVGHVVFSPVTISGHHDLRCFILAPMAVSPTRQRAGIGGKLIQEGLDRLSKDGVQAVFVLGDPAYYNRSGFSANHEVGPPYELPYPEAWQVKELEPGILSGVSGTIECLPVLMSPEYW